MPTLLFHHPLTHCFTLSSSPVLCSSTSTAGPEDEQALHALERMLQQKERHLEGQQAKLAAWAAELQRREAALVWQQAQMAGRALDGAGAAATVAPAAAAMAAAAASPGSSLGPPLEPIPSASPVMPAGHAATPPSARPATPPSVSPLYAARAGLAAQEQQPTADQQQTASPAAMFGGGSGSPGALPDSPAVPGEWTEDFEPGVLLSFATEAGAKKLRRIRFSRSLFSADSAKQVGLGLLAIAWWACERGCVARHPVHYMHRAMSCCASMLAVSYAAGCLQLSHLAGCIGKGPELSCPFSHLPRSGTKQTSTGWRRPLARRMQAPRLRWVPPPM